MRNFFFTKLHEKLFLLLLLLFCCFVVVVVVVVVAAAAAAVAAATEATVLRTVARLHVRGKKIIAKLHEKLFLLLL